jgi:hypothetical protein
MNLWLLERTEHAGYLFNQRVIVRAESEENARKIASLADSEDGDNPDWKSSFVATCKILLVDGEEGLIIQDNTGA